MINNQYQYLPRTSAAGKRTYITDLAVSSIKHSQILKTTFISIQIKIILHLYLLDDKETMLGIYLLLQII